MLLVVSVAAVLLASTNRSCAVVAIATRRAWRSSHLELAKCALGQAGVWDHLLAATVVPVAPECCWVDTGAASKGRKITKRSIDESNLVLHRRDTGSTQRPFACRRAVLSICRTSEKKCSGNERTQSKEGDLHDFSCFEPKDSARAVEPDS